MKTTLLVLLLIFSFTCYSQQVITGVKMTDKGVIYSLNNGLLTNPECSNERYTYKGDLLKIGDSVVVKTVKV